MMLTRLLRHSLLIKPSVFSFSNGAIRTGSQLHTQILGLTNWQDFMTLFANEKESFTPEVITGTSRHLISILSKNRESINFGLVKELLDSIEGIDTATMTPRNIISLLSLLRNLTYKGFTLNRNNQLRTRLMQTYLESLKNNTIPTEEISDLLFAYFEMVYFKEIAASKILANLILTNLNKDDPNNPNLLTPTQLNFIVHVLAIKGELTETECRIRKYTLSTVANKVNLMKVKDIVTICVDLNKMDTFDMEPDEFNNIKIIGEKIIDSLHELEERSIYDFLRGDHISRHPIFPKIYDEILKSIFAEINEAGETDMDHDSIIKMLSYLSNKINFSRLPELEKSKYMSFLLCHAKELRNQNDIENSLQFQNTLLQFIENNFFDRSKQDKLVEIIKIACARPKLLLVESLYSKGIDVTAYLPDVFEANVDKLSPAKLLKMAMFFNNLNKDKHYSTFKEKIEICLSNINQRIQEFFSSEKDFIQFVRQSSVFRKEINLVAFNNFYSSFFQSLQNPFESEFTLQQYPIAYIQYILHTFKFKDAIEFLNKNEENITDEQFAKLIMQHLEVDSRDVEPSRKLAYLVYKRTSKSLAAKERNSLYWAIELINKYNRFTVRGSLDKGTEALVFKILHELLGKLEILVEMNIQGLLSTTLSKYITRNHKNYNVETPYRELLAHSLSKIPLFRSKSLVESLLDEGLRLNIVSSKCLQNVDVDKYYLSYANKARLMYIKDNNYIPTIKSINIRLLPTILSNPHLEPYVTENATKIKEVINKMHITTACQTIVSFNLPLTKNTSPILAALLKKVEQSSTGIDRADLLGLVQFINRGGHFRFPSNRKIAEKIIEFLKRNIQSYSLSSHIQFISFISTQPNLNPLDYYNALVSYARQDYYDSDYDQLLYKLSYTNYPLKPEDLNRIKTIVSKQLFNGLSLFLRYENSLEQAERKAIVQQIVQQLNQKKDSKIISELRYNYLKHFYPEETKDLQLQSENFSSMKFSTKPRQDLLSVVHQVAQSHKIAPEEVEQQLLDENTGYKIGNYLLVFLTPRSQGAFFEHDFLKRALKQHYEAQGTSLEVIMVGLTNETGLVHFLHKTSGQLVNDELLKSVTDRLRERFSSKKKAEEEETD